VDVLSIQHRKENNEEKGGGENIHPHRIQVGCPPTLHIFAGKETRFPEKILHGNKELAIKMCNVREKMVDEMADGLPGFYIFLTANRTITLRGGGSAIKANFFRSDLTV